MRILHTSDWHLGLQSGRFSRHEEHERFFAWLHEALAGHKVDALVVAGDIFDSMHPSNEALRLYYRFLRNVKQSGVRDIVIVGGNHDSASQLDAPSSVLAALDVHVAGGYSREADKLSYLAPLRRRGSDTPVAVCIALPYVHEWRLGIRTTGDKQSTLTEFTERFRALYSELSDLAQERYPGLPLIGTGHLTMGKGEKGDSPQEIHQVGFIDSLPASVLDSRLRYVALGHIHRSFPVEPERTWYSGSPIPMSLPEMQRPRRVLLVDIPANSSPAQITPLEVPVVRKLIEFQGEEEELLTKVRELRDDSPLPPFLFLKVEVKQPEPQLAARVREALNCHAIERRPLLVELRELFVGKQSAADEEAVVPLEELTPQEVFIKLCTQRKVETNAELLQAFNFIASTDKETLESRVEEISRGISI